jgi:sugar phosphate isomerase/epimerase
VKDVAPKGEKAEEDGWADIGDGVVDWKRLLPALSVGGVELIVLEHDNPSDFERFARRSRVAVAAW